MKWLKKIRIDFERWKFRRKQAKALKHDADAKANACLKANHMSENLKARLWVIKHGTADYGIYKKNEVKGYLRSIGLQSVINMYQPNEYIIHITKKPE